MSLFLVGSGPVEGLDAVYDEFVQQARAFGGVVAVAMLGEPDDVQQHVADYTRPLAERWPEAEIRVIALDDEGGTAWPDDFEQVAGLVVAGGWTPGYLDALIPQRDAISRLVRGGIPYLGFSAGAMVVSRHAIVGGYRLRGRQLAPEHVSEGLEELSVRDGLALIGPTIETHTDTWANLGVAIAALEASEARTAATIDEGTCLVVEPASGRSRVLGPGRVHWLQREGIHTVIAHDVDPAHAPAPDAASTGSEAGDASSPDADAAETPGN